MAKVLHTNLAVEGPRDRLFSVDGEGGGLEVAERLLLLEGRELRLRLSGFRDLVSVLI